nr:vegetative cell wall protein gp1-like [Aegilops tauschii subsp. strangulata]
MAPAEPPRLRPSADLLARSPQPPRCLLLPLLALGSRRCCSTQAQPPPLPPARLAIALPGLCPPTTLLLPAPLPTPGPRLLGPAPWPLPRPPATPCMAQPPLAVASSAVWACAQIGQPPRPDAAARSQRCLPTGPPHPLLLSIAPSSPGRPRSAVAQRRLNLVVLLLDSSPDSIDPVLSVVASSPSSSPRPAAQSPTPPVSCRPPFFPLCPGVVYGAQGRPCPSHAPRLLAAHYARPKLRQRVFAPAPEPYCCCTARRPAELPVSTSSPLRCRAHLQLAPRGPSLPRVTRACAGAHHGAPRASPRSWLLPSGPDFAPRHPCSPARRNRHAACYCRRSPSNPVAAALHRRIRHPLPPARLAIALPGLCPPTTLLLPAPLPTPGPRFPGPASWPLPRPPATPSMARPPLVVASSAVWVTRDNYRTELIDFDITRISLPYNAILGYPALAQFMAATHTAYNLMKMQGSSDVLTVAGDTKEALTALNLTFTAAAAARPADGAAPGAKG